jgi:hypothetical protein
MSELGALLTQDGIVIAAVIAALAGLMRGFTGFGSSMLMAPVFAILYGPATAVVIIITMDVIVSAQLVPRAVSEARWRFVLPMAAAAIAAMPVGGWILTSVDADIVTRGMAGLVLALVLVLASGWRYDGPRSLPLTLGVGALSGTLMASTSMGGPPVLVYMLTGRESARFNRANIIVYFALTGVALLCVMALSGFMSLRAAGTALVLTPVFALFTYFGARMFSRAEEAIYRRVALIFLAGVALYTLFR